MEVPIRSATVRSTAGAAALHVRHVLNYLRDRQRGRCPPAAAPYPEPRQALGARELRAEPGDLSPKPNQGWWSMSRYEATITRSPVPQVSGRLTPHRHGQHRTRGAAQHPRNGHGEFGP
ncbi:MAG: hypothetical protein WKF58_19105 [Ilumatobacteraceae bacterium]